MDSNLAYMYKMIQEAKGNFPFSKEMMMEYGAQVDLFPGVREWFERIREYGDSKGVIIEHYIISSGLKEMIEGTPVAKSFERIYASSFYYDEDGIAQWPAQAVNYTNKTQFLFRIEKGILDVNDPGVNDHLPNEEKRVPFQNMVYIGDSDTDVPCMTLINMFGGHSIGVYDVKTKDKTKVYRMMRDGRIKYYAPADYSEGTELDIIVKAIIDRTASNEALENIHYQHKKEYLEEDMLNNAEEKRKTDLIISLENSGNFVQTHTIIRELMRYTEWTEEEIARLMEIALENSQVHFILKDSDVKAFYQMLLGKMEQLTMCADVVAREIG
jgi:2-hydroxy-3-keto-5-methylthiopentenyl-1-phosphate phosphatase